MPALMRASESLAPYLGRGCSLDGSMTLVVGHPVVSGRSSEDLLDKVGGDVVVAAAVAAGRAQSLRQSCSFSLRSVDAPGNLCSDVKRNNKDCTSEASDR